MLYVEIEAEEKYDYNNSKYILVSKSYHELDVNEDEVIDIVDLMMILRRLD